MTDINQSETCALRVRNSHVLTLFDDVCTLDNVLIHMPFERTSPALHGIALASSCPGGHCYTFDPFRGLPHFNV